MKAKDGRTRASAMQRRSIVLSRTTLQKLKQLAVGEFVSTATARADGMFDVPVSADVSARIDRIRRSGETDESVVLRLVRGKRT